MQAQSRNALLLEGLQLLSLSIILDGSTVTQLDSLEAGSSDDTDLARHQTEIDDADILRCLAFERFFAAFTTPILRGPYNQFSKDVTFFRISMEWPDRWFRSLYRCVLC